MLNSIVLEGKEICIGYKSKKKPVYIHKNIDFTLKKGKLTCLLGANGAGKSTLLRTLSSTQPLLGGELLLMGKDINSYSEKEISRTVGVVLTEKTQTGGLSVYELVSLGRQPHTGFFGRLSKHDNDVIYRALEAVGISHKAKSYTAELSDGERQKAMIAKALVQECPIILLDEPTAFLDVVSRIEIMTLLHKLAKEEEKAILMSTHDIEQALVLSDYLWLLTSEGLYSGVTEDVILSGKMNTLFPDSEISFDLMHGVYSPTVKSEKAIILKAENEVLKHWTQNALNREGYLCLEYRQQAEFLEKHHGIPIINVISPQKISYTYHGKTELFNSFGELISFIIVNFMGCHQ